MTKGVVKSTYFPMTTQELSRTAPPRLQKQKFNRLIADDLRARILSGMYAVGSLLPTEPALALEYGSNRNTLREAIRILETQGFVTVRQGAGVSVVDFRRHPTIELIGYLLAQAQPSAETLQIVLDLLGLRKLLAVEVAHRAAGHLSKATARDIRKLIRSMVAEDLAEQERTEIDRQILALLVQSTGSLVYAALFNSIYRVIAEGAAATPALTTLPGNYAERMERVLHCMVAGDGAGAGRAMGALCEASDAVLLRSLQESLESST